jgi:16S rRNA (guanine527-N7)-methyltransferase
MIDRIQGIKKAAPASQIAADLIESAAHIGVAIDDLQCNSFLMYYNELITWNRQINLISENSVQEIVKRHFVDSLIPMHYLNPQDGFLIDLGSGGGFPGVPLKIMRPEMHVCLVDSSRKKTSFLSHLSVVLHLNKTDVIRGRIEDIVTESRFSGAFDTVISRAAFKLSPLLVFSSYLLRQGGQLIAMKGANLQKELLAAERTATKAGMELNIDCVNDSFINNHAKNIAIYNRT